MGVKPIIAVKTVTTAGTRVQLSTTDLYVTSVYFEGLRTNTGNIYIGDVLVSSTVYAAALAALQGFAMSVDVPWPASQTPLNLKTMYIDSAINGEKVCMTYFERVGSY